jgi:hypothetical protein
MAVEDTQLALAVQASTDSYQAGLQVWLCMYRPALPSHLFICLEGCWLLLMVLLLLLLLPKAEVARQQRQGRCQCLAK